MVPVFRFTYVCLLHPLTRAIVNHSFQKLYIAGFALTPQQAVTIIYIVAFFHKKVFLLIVVVHVCRNNHLQGAGNNFSIYIIYLAQVLPVHLEMRLTPGFNLK